MSSLAFCSPQISTQHTLLDLLSYAMVDHRCKPHTQPARTRWPIVTIEIRGGMLRRNSTQKIPIADALMRKPLDCVFGCQWFAEKARDISLMGKETRQDRTIDDSKLHYSICTLFPGIDHKSGSVSASNFQFGVRSLMFKPAIVCLFRSSCKLR